MIIKKPLFWDKKKPNFLAHILNPISKFIELINFLKQSEGLKFSNIKIICVGNIYIGGTGKTPLSIRISKMLNEKNLKTTVVKKFYIDQKDEQLLISSKTNLITKKHRIDCINAAISKNFKYAIFDDGLQDKSINYDLKICCFNSDNWIDRALILVSFPFKTFKLSIFL